MRRHQPGVVGQCGGVAFRHAAAPLQHLRQAAQLHHADAGLHIRDAEIVADLGIGLEGGWRGAVAVEIRQRHALVPLPAQPRGQLGVVCQDHAAFAGGDQLAGVQAEDGGPRQPAHRPAAEARADGAGGVLDHQQAMPCRNLVDAVDLAGQPDLVDRQYRLGARRDAVLDVVGVDVVGGRVDIGEDRRGADMDDDIDRGDEGQRRHDDLVARADAEFLQQQEAAGGPGGDADPFGRAAELGEAGLQFPQTRAADHPAAAHRGGGGGFLLGAEIRAAEGNLGHAAGSAAGGGMVQFSTLSSSRALASGWRAVNQAT